MSQLFDQAIERARALSDRRQDEVGTPFCVTVDFESLDDGQVTVRERDTMSQDRIAIDTLVPYLRDRL